MDDDNYFENDDHGPSGRNLEHSIEGTDPEASLEQEISDTKLEYAVNPEDEPLKKKKLSPLTLMALALLGFITLSILIGGISTIFHSLKGKGKVEDDSINFSKISEDHSIENIQHQLEAQQTEADNEDLETDSDLDNENLSDDLSIDSGSEIKTPPSEPAPPVIFEYALGNNDETAQSKHIPDSEEKNDDEHPSASSSQVSASQQGFISAGFEAIPPRYRLSKGHNILCTLKNKIDTSYPGIATCVIAKPVFSDDGTTVLIERGSVVIGDQAGSLSGTHRAFITWREIKTPENVTIPIGAPVADNLGATGVNGKINYQLLKKFFLGTAISIIETGEKYLIEKTKKPNSSIVNFADSSSSMAQQFDELYKSMNEELIEKRTLVVNPGAQINIQLNQDLDFSKVYQKE